MRLPQVFFNLVRDCFLCLQWWGRRLPERCLPLEKNDRGSTLTRSLGGPRLLSAFPAVYIGSFQEWYVGVAAKRPCYLFPLSLAVSLLNPRISQFTFYQPYWPPSCPLLGIHITVVIISYPLTRPICAYWGPLWRMLPLKLWKWLFETERCKQWFPIILR